MVAGIALGLAAAAAQSASYFFSRLFVVRREQGILRLMVLGHLIMGGLSLAALPLLWPPILPPANLLIKPLIGCAGFYLLGQVSFFVALRHADASRAAPLLGLKILILAAIAVVFLNQPLGPMQWAAVIVCAAAAFMLNYSGGALPLEAIAGIVAACTAYSLSDLNIGWLVGAMRGGAAAGAGGLGQLHASLLGVCLCYIICGAAALAFWPLVGKATAADWKYAAPFALSWLTAMIFLFTCFDAVGVVFGNIVQSTRGLISIAVGARIAGAGLEHLEKRVPRGVLLRRVCAAGMMTAAVVMYCTALP